MKQFILVENTINSEINRLVETCKSSSMVAGRTLRDAHYKLGGRMAPQIGANISDKQVTVIVLLRAGLCFAQGIADTMEDMGFKVSLLFLNESYIPEKDVEYIDNKNVLVVDAVINSGKSIFALMECLQKARKVLLATTVIPSESLGLFIEHSLFCVRTSQNKYIGAKVNKISNGKGPDTGDRLFNTM